MGVTTDRPGGCSGCRAKDIHTFDFSMAFQPILDIEKHVVFAQEALARGPAGESVATLFDQVDESNQYWFDQNCRIKAIELASKLGLEALVNVNFMPYAVYNPERCIQTTLKAAADTGFPTERIVFEFTETQRVVDPGFLLEIIRYYQKVGFKTAIDDFGAGYSGLDLLAEVQTDFIKLDMALIRGIDQDRTRQAIVRHCAALCAELGIAVIAEGVETLAEMRTVADLGISLQQGFLFARPAFQCLPDPAWP